MLEVVTQSVLVIIDVQRAFEHEKWGERNNPAAEENVARLLTSWRSRQQPVIHVRHRNLVAGKLFSPEAPTFQPKPEAAELPGEPVIYKSVNSSFIGTDLEARLRALDAGAVVFCGITTDHCVSTTVRMAGNLGFDTYVVGDACATFERLGADGRHWTAEDMHSSALASLSGEFATVVSADEVAGSL
jgi:nicotinamidase-related amidase